jgi:hypothetical protein
MDNAENVIPLLAKEGWLRHQKTCEATFDGADGVVNLELPPRPLLSKVASRHFLEVASTPPLQGGELPFAVVANSFYFWCKNPGGLS